MRHMYPCLLLDVVCCFFLLVFLLLCIHATCDAAVLSIIYWTRHWKREREIEREKRESIYDPKRNAKALADKVKLERAYM